MERFSLCICLIVLCSAAAIGDPKSKKDVDKEHFPDGEHNKEFDQESVLGKEEALEYQHLTPEQSKEKLSTLIPIIDKDGDEAITENELKDHIKFMQKRYILKDVERTWTNYGGNKTKDGKLSWSDYRHTIYGPEDAANDMSSEYAQMLARDERRWKLADTTKDDMLDKEEYACFVHPEDCDHMKDIIVTETVEDIDKNKDGAVDIEEYIADMYRPDEKSKDEKEPDWVQSEREMFKTYRDKNGDGKLDNDELKEWIMPTGFDHAEAEAKHLMQLADDDKDGKLSKEEILKHYDAFVGSQATDYGEQLQKHDPSEL